VKLTDFEALSFDCYGTLIDWEAGIAAVLGPWARSRGVGDPAGPRRWAERLGALREPNDRRAGRGRASGRAGRPGRRKPTAPDAHGAWQAGG
jgi:FMN phosphatase YigB (HAD superfamily)